jgi:hypothetical protein
MTNRGHLAEIATHQPSLPRVFTQPRPKAVIPLVQILGHLQRTDFVERGDYRDFTESIPLLRIAASAASDPRKWINR